MEVEEKEGGGQGKEETKGESRSVRRKKRCLRSSRRRRRKRMTTLPLTFPGFYRPPQLLPPPPPRHRRRMCRWGRWRRAAGILPSPFLRPSSGLLQWSADNRRDLIGLRAAFGLRDGIHSEARRVAGEEGRAAFGPCVLSRGRDCACERVCGRVLCCVMARREAMEGGGGGKRGA